MKYRRLGRSGLKVSEISLGSWLTYGKSVEDNVAERTIKQAYDLGLIFLIQQMLMKGAKGTSNVCRITFLSA